MPAALSLYVDGGARGRGVASPGADATSLCLSNSFRLLLHRRSNYLQGELQQLLLLLKGRRDRTCSSIITMISTVQLRSNGSFKWSTSTAAAAARMLPSSCIAPTIDLDCTMMIRVSDDDDDDDDDIRTTNVLVGWLRLLFRASSLLSELSTDGVTADLNVYVDDTSSQQSMTMMMGQQHRLLPVMRHVLALVVRECGWSDPVVTTTTTTNPQPPPSETNSYAETAMIQLTALRAFARVVGRSKGGGGGALDGSVVANLFFSSSSSQAMLLSSLLSDEAAPPHPTLALRRDDDVLSQLVRGRVSLWLHDIELADEVIFQQSMKLFRTHKSIMQV